MRILMVAARYFPFMGGIESHIHEVGRRVAERGHAVTILTSDASGQLPKAEVLEGMEVVRVGQFLRSSDFCLAPGLVTRLLRGKWDVVHVQGYHTFSAPFAMAASLIKRVPFVLTFHSGGHSSRARNAIRSMQQSGLRPLAARAAQLIGVSQFEADHFSQQMRIPRDRFIVVPNGASLPKPTAEIAIDRAAPLIVSLGRLERYKGHHRVIDAFAALLKLQPGARLRVLGDGPNKPELLRLVEQLGLQDRVDIGSIPATERSAMADMLAGASLVMLMSEYEAHPVAVMEALSLNVPVITSDTSGFRELAEQGLVTALPIASSREELAQAMNEVLNTPRRITPVALPSWDQCTDRLLSIYRSVSKPRYPNVTAQDVTAVVDRMAE